jgi:hypothetical protein
MRMHITRFIQQPTAASRYCATRRVAGHKEWTVNGIIEPSTRGFGSAAWILEDHRAVGQRKTTRNATNQAAYLRS